MKTVDWSSLSGVERAAALARPARLRDESVTRTVERIFDEIESDGFGAVRRWSLALDKSEPAELQLSRRVVDGARGALAREDLAALDMAVENVVCYHEATKPQAIAVDVRPGVRCTQTWRPIATCGLYAPGGTAPLFSTLIMLAAPAAVAGVPRRVAVTPPNVRGAPQPMMIAAAAACGLETLWQVGGAQAIAALAFGAGLPKADKIFGPGNVYVVEAKRRAGAMAGGPAIDMPAGPSELMVIADDSADAGLVAADLLSQAEHDGDAQVLLVTVSARLIEAVRAELERQMPLLPRAAIAAAAMAHARCVRVRDDAEAAAVANAYAPEHLSVQVGDPDRVIALIENAGAVFVGASSGETFGDYVCGPSHALPTDGAARAWSGIGVASFMKSFAVQDISAGGARALAGAAARLARLEGLEAHARAAEMRAQ